MRARGAHLESLWILGPLAKSLLRKKHALGILVAVYELGPINTTDIIRSTRGHPASIIETLCSLEEAGVLRRCRSPTGHHSLEIRLTVKGIQLMDAPIKRWGRILEKWGSLHT